MENLSGGETYEHLGEELGRTTSGELILRAEEFGERLDSLGLEGAQLAIEQAVAPNVPLDKSIWK
ncbi:hypothetical protein HY468_03935 [Candidatus Roizmanbacteria bacterium]|nr:hypothetical protein [Candidatus Roizmanbacteria bacterium]